jgi:uncharacterized protein YcbK (DUF882 family)
MSMRIDDVSSATRGRPRRAALSRRRFLGQAAAGLALLPLGRALGATPEPQQRSLALVHTHTGEHLTTTYFAHGQYLPDALQRLNQLLRDVRTGEVYPIAPQTLDILADLRTLAGSSERYQVICGYRSPQTNAALRRHSRGVAEHSLHMQGRALDVRLSGCATARLHELALGMRRGGVGYYPQSDFIHVDNGPVRSW